MAKVVIDIDNKSYAYIKNGVMQGTDFISAWLLKVIREGVILPKEKSILKEWVSVSERLPDKEGTYLLWGRVFDDEEYYCFIGDYDESCERFGYGCLGSKFIEYECVLAWQELPKPYKENKEGQE